MNISKENKNVAVRLAGLSNVKGNHEFLTSAILKELTLSHREIQENFIQSLKNVLEIYEKTE